MPLTTRPSNYNLRSGNEAPGHQASEDPVEDLQQQNVVQLPPNVGQENPEPAQVNSSNISINSNMASVFRLENFKGDGSQDIKSYLKRFDQYKGCTGINKTQGLATLAWHLEGTARL